MGERIYLNNDWYFTETFSDALLSSEADTSALTSVRIPHTVKETPFHYFDESEYQMVSGYVKKLTVDPAWEGKTLLLTFEAVGHDATVYVNGREAGSHHSGYTAFTLDITDFINFKSENTIVVRCDSRETLNTPPFGFVIDYMTYGGIYREVYLDIREESYIADCYIASKLSDRYALPTEETRLFAKKSQVFSRIEVKHPKPGMKIVQELLKKGDDTVLVSDETASVNEVTEFSFFTGDVELWDIENPALYEMRTRLLDADGREWDSRTDTFGFRKAVFKERGFYLNGRKVKIRGLNRHQSYPYVGYAMPASMQRRDADILKYELGVNAARTSHYPQSHDFISRCDEIGLLVFTEFPGWQHIGDTAWKEQALTNLREMITEYRNHPSIILWGARINESIDDDAFYTETNALAHTLDPYRQTGGVRCYKKGSLLEDVFTYNDFVHDGKHPGCEPKRDVTPDVKKPYLISEYNGHMYPTKTFDWEEHRTEHALRHANVLNEVARQKDISGSFGWCMFDYNTHKDFGSGDRICYHGVMDMFRNPKMAAAIYAAQQDETPVLSVSSTMDIGEHPGSNRGNIYIFTNADSVRMYKNDVFIKEYDASDSTHPFMKHGPLLVNDYIGSTLEENEGMPHRQAEDVKRLLNETARYGLYGLPKTAYLKALRMILAYHMKMSDAVELYNKYIGDWGGASKSYRFEAIKGGRIVKTLIITPMTKQSLAIDVDHTDLTDGRTYDVAAVRIRAVDEHGNTLPFMNDPVTLKTTGGIRLIGPNMVSLQGGMGGTYVKTTGKKGKATLKITTQTNETYTVDFNVN